MARVRAATARVDSGAVELIAVLLLNRGPRVLYYYLGRRVKGPSGLKR